MEEKTEGKRKTEVLQISPKIESCMDWVDRPKKLIIRVCTEFCNFCKVPIWTCFNRRLLNLVG